MQSNQRVTISRGNRKLGAIMNVSTEPVQCCPKGIPCAEGGCYALKFLRLYPETRKAWAKNARIAKTNPRSYSRRLPTGSLTVDHVASDGMSLAISWASTISAKCAESL